MRDFVNFFYPKNKEFTAPQVVLQKSKRRTWYPGKKAKTPREIPLDRADLIGFGGRLYRDHFTPKQDQEFLLCFGIIDIDDLGVMTRAISREIKIRTPSANIRLSKSGEGLHLLFRFENLLILRTNQEANAIIKESLRGISEVLNHMTVAEYPEVVNLKICGYPEHAWFFGPEHIGGLLYQSDLKIPAIIPEKKTGSPIDLKEGEWSWLMDQNGDARKEFIELLNEKGAILSQFDEAGVAGVHIRSAHEAVKGTRFEFGTKSPMNSAEVHNNGFLSFQGSYLKLIPAADGQCRLKVNALGAWRVDS